jgi:hypothetical protein
MHVHELAVHRPCDALAAANLVLGDLSDECSLFEAFFGFGLQYDIFCSVCTAKGITCYNRVMGDGHVLYTLALLFPVLDASARSTIL